MPKVFISFSSKNNEIARKIKEQLQKRQFDCWFAPDNIMGGESYLSTIPKAISNSDAFILLLSKDSQTSFWVKNEVEQAINKQIPIFPIMIEDCEITEEFAFCLSHIQIFRYDNDINKSIEQFVKKHTEINNSYDRKLNEKFDSIPTTLPKQGRKESNSNSIIIGLVLGWLGAVLNTLFMFVFFPYTFLQTVAILVIMILFSARKYSQASWIIYIVCSILSFAFFNIISSIMFYKKCNNNFQL